MTTQLASAPAPDRIPFADCHIAAGSRRAAHRVLESGWVTTGPEVAAFEAEFAAYVGAAHAIAVSSCTAALELSCATCGSPQGAPVLVSDLTFCGAVQAIVHAGLRPVLVDVSPVTGMPTPETTHAAHTRCGGAEAMVVVHWAGDPADVAALAAAADLPLDRVVEDAAHAVGTAHGVPAGRGRSGRLLQLLRHQEPPHRGGRHDHHRRPGACELAAPGAAARHVGRRVASLPARRGLAVRRPRGRHEGQHDRRAGRHRPRPARAAPPVAGDAGAPRRALRPLARRPSRAGAPPPAGAGSGRPRLAPVPGAGRGPGAVARRGDGGAGRGRRRHLAALHPDPSPRVLRPRGRRAARGAPRRRDDLRPADLAAALPAPARRPDPPGGRRAGRRAGRASRGHPDARVAGRSPVTRPRAGAR